MKKIIICSALLFAFFSCSKDQQTQTPGTDTNGTAIEFNSSVNQSIVRGVPVEGTALCEDFGVFGYCDPMTEPDIDKAMSCLDPDFMFNQKVDYTLFYKFIYSPVKFWPTTGGVDFFAYAPYHSNHYEFSKPKNSHDEGYPVVDYKVKSTVSQQEDFMVAEALRQVGTSPCVNFDFKHALCKVGVEAYMNSNCSEQYDVVITKIEFKKIKDCGKFRYAFLDEDSSKWWSDVEGSADYHVGVCNHPYGGFHMADEMGGAPHGRPAGILVEAEKDDDCYTRVNEFNQYLLAIPQCFDESHCGGGATLCVTYYIWDKCLSNSQKPVYYTVELPLKDTQCWDPGFCIEYVICIDLNVVTFDAHITPWKDCIEVEEEVNPGDC